MHNQGKRRWKGKMGGVDNQEEDGEEICKREGVG